MCDTIVVLGNSTEDGAIIFGKNSDRDPNEAHAICYLPRSTHQQGEEIQCQYMSIPQVSETCSVILAKPVWLRMGCEMGANEYGIVMGNEAVFTKEKYEKTALLGMDLMTLALQRAKTAREALNIITELITQWGQGGVASQNGPNFVYHNSFIVADLKEAWVLETAGKFWVAKKVADVATISNGLTIKDKWDLASPGLIENAVERGWCESKSQFDFAECYSDPGKRALSGCIDRQSRTINRLLDRKGQINISLIMKILRDHGTKFDEQPFDPVKGTMSSICGHANALTVHQTTGSYVADLSKDLQTHWLTGTSAPCLSVFKPFFFEIPEALRKLKTPSLSNDNSLWWVHEKLHRMTLMDYLTRSPVIMKKNNELEQALIKSVDDIKQNFPRIDKNQLNIKLNELSSNAIKNNYSLIKILIETLSKMEISKETRKSYIKFWENLSQKDGLPLK